MMGGRMWLESEGMGHRSTFYFTIQFASAAGPERMAVENQSPVEEGSTSNS
ncbi:MAG: hypothetical protein CME05_13000 [Gemmatimonadaceae bacterium]|nr:hypothetical protein [Gemmatimonadaceae bacterium]